MRVDLLPSLMVKNSPCAGKAWSLAGPRTDALNSEFASYTQPGRQPGCAKFNQLLGRWESALVLRRGRRLLPNLADPHVSAKDWVIPTGCITWKVGC
jgi:hypothetical protein